MGSGYAAQGWEQTATRTASGQRKSFSRAILGMFLLFVLYLNLYPLVPFVCAPVAQNLYQHCL